MIQITDSKDVRSSGPTFSGPTLQLTSIMDARQILQELEKFDYKKIKLISNENVTIKTFSLKDLKHYLFMELFNDPVENGTKNLIYYNDCIFYVEQIIDNKIELLFRGYILDLY